MDVSGSTGFEEPPTSAPPQRFSGSYLPARTFSHNLGRESAAAPVNVQVVNTPPNPSSTFNRLGNIDLRKTISTLLLAGLGIAAVTTGVELYSEQWPNSEYSQPWQNFRIPGTDINPHRAIIDARRRAFEDRSKPHDVGSGCVDGDLAINGQVSSQVLCARIVSVEPPSQATGNVPAVELSLAAFDAADKKTRNHPNSPESWLTALISGKQCHAEVFELLGLALKDSGRTLPSNTTDTGSPAAPNGSTTTTAKGNGWNTTGGNKQPALVNLLAQDPENTGDVPLDSKLRSACDAA